MHKWAKINIGFYLICMGVILCFWLYLCTNVANEVYDSRTNDRWTLVEDFTVRKVKDVQAPLGYRNVYELQLKAVKPGGEALVFYSLHQRVNVSIDGTGVYSFSQKAGQKLIKTPGNSWNFIPIFSSDTGKNIRIELTPVYRRSADVVPDFYFGSQVAIERWIIGQKLPALLLALLSILVGLCFIAYTLLNLRSAAEDRSLLLMGLFAVFVGVWKLTDCDVLSLFNNNTTALSTLPLLILLLIVIPFVEYVRGMFTTPGVLWQVPSGVSGASMVICMVLQMLGIADLRETLWMTHLSMLIMGVVIISMFVLEVRKGLWSKKLRRLLIGVGVCLLGLSADLIVYYMSNGLYITSWSMAGFVFYIVLLGGSSLREVHGLLEAAKKAQLYEQMAYRDQMTGLYNRTAYAAYTGSADFVPKDYTAVVLDLNNLKRCNDTLGHDKGDLYIFDSAALIFKVYGEAGRCFRIGGDEFCVLMKGHTRQECDEMELRLQHEVELWNQNHDEGFDMQIAAGYAMFDEENDFNFEDTVRRADRKMYHAKFVMKQASA